MVSITAWGLRVAVREKILNEGDSPLGCALGRVWGNVDK